MGWQEGAAQTSHSLVVAFDYTHSFYKAAHGTEQKDSVFKFMENSWRSCW